ncbi:hypothetical protein M409DRAFT_20576 [Zasmidium cellare ATCC 36951]|uniref:Prolyl 4-hydroxylase alpha subunit domain-containing protein n=1 Tax=Zasmidium cellare ATCC 36951 TaxID=1080233 RepID=A0A6A6CU44_ZASCE|nr:uncharacterized protein M409DRAFT_20576 [Zasmidium cellare ATCC 36951]KAF2169352.1 hypothetical protein M409DRAFT_20576 [Zasmidium cellare ATCC 36951]
MAPKAKARRPKADSAAATPSDQARKGNSTSLNWPSMEPVMVAGDLALDTLLADQILTVKLWTVALCKSYRTFLATLPLVTTPGRPKRGEATRVNDRFHVDDEDFAAKLWSQTALQALITNPVINGVQLGDADKRNLWGGDVLGLNSNIRIYRYSKGQFFDQHYDDSNNVSFPSSSSPNAQPAKTTWTLLLYLSSPATGCQGGATIFHPEPSSKRQAAPDPIVAELEVGLALLHRHGKECLLHEGQEVTDGEKWVIRTDLCVKR